MPLCLDVAGKRILLIGGGKVALHKAVALLRFTDEATVISPAFTDGFDALPFTRVCKTFEPADLEGAFLVYICTENENLNAAVKAECAARGILACVCDNPALCDFISPAVWKSENMSVAVSSNGQDVRRSIALRDKIRQLIES
ncbi:MAG: bifunctional precorrin-2 dehydrogenase/sirohydrochlorin ferrochelatase [Bacteroidales bacterium]|nr:bifunctional precorrin-2 dehydrogenase/sirohydrochlorin ferrochelatase [Bacteroidales bacterium]